MNKEIRQVPLRDPRASRPGFGRSPFLRCAERRYHPAYWFSSCISSNSSWLHPATCTSPIWRSLAPPVFQELEELRGSLFVGFDLHGQ